MKGQIVLASPKEFFFDALEESLRDRKVIAPLAVKSYLVSLLEYYLHTENLFDEDVTESGARVPNTLAELYLGSKTVDSAQGYEMLKKLADRSLYVSGFFGDSLNRKLVDVDYYVEMGGTAYAALAEQAREDMKSQVFRSMSNQFVAFVDVFTLISQKTGQKTNQSLLRTYEKYLRTGSDLAREKLVQAGIITVPKTDLKKASQ